MNEGRFVLAEKKSPGRLFYVIQNSSQLSTPEIFSKFGHKPEIIERVHER